MPDRDQVLSFGVDASSGWPLEDLSDAEFATMLGVPVKPHDDLTAALASRADAEVKRRIEGGASAYGVQPDAAGTSSNCLGRAGWGILYGPTVDAKIKKALAPLIKLRQDQGAAPFIVYDTEGILPGESDDVYAWLRRHKVRLDQVAPENGVPYYLLIVASPQDISFEFQYTLDLYWACGRLWFDTAEEFSRYAESVKEYERAEPTLATSRQLAVFSPEHDFDGATQLFVRHVAKPLCGFDGERPLGEDLHYRLHQFLGARANKSTFGEILRGRSCQGTPALLFSGSHGMQFPSGDPLQLDAQGAIVCQDWEGYGAITADHWFAAKDVPADAQVHGMIHFMFACHGGGVPRWDDFDRRTDQPAEIAPQAFFSRLPQALLAHKNGGALAVLAHMERAWAYSFLGENGTGQSQGFRGVLNQVLRGDRIGYATDTFNVRWAAVATRLSDELFRFAKIRGDDERRKALKVIRRLWVERDDARNFMVFGDPAVALRADRLK